MTDIQVVSREAMFARGAADARRGRSRDDHGMNPWADAVVEYQLGHDYVTSARRKAQPAARVMEVTAP